MRKTLYAVLCAILFSLSGGLGTGHGREAGVVPVGGARDIQRIVIEEAALAGIPPGLALAVAHTESGFRPRAESEKGARGIMQIMPATAWDVFGVHRDRLWDTRLNVQLGLEFLNRLYRQYDKRWDLALSHYNGGTLKKGPDGGYRPHSFTRKYIHKVMTGWDDYERDHWVRQQVAAAIGGPGPAERQGRREDVQPLPSIKPPLGTIRSRSVGRSIDREDDWSASGDFSQRLKRARRTLDDFG